MRTSRLVLWTPVFMIFAACSANPVEVPKVKVPVIDVDDTDGNTEAPTALDASVTTDEDTPVTVEFAVEASAAAGAIAVTIEQQPAHGTLTNAGDTYTYTPAADFNGADTITFTGTAGGVKSATGTVTITVNPINDAPAFTKGGDENVLEDAAPVTVAGWATGLSEGPNEAEQSLSFVVTNDNNALFAAQPAISAAGDLSYTLAANAHGSATVTVSATDNGGTEDGGVAASAGQTFVITVLARNDTPAFTKGNNQTHVEDASPVSLSGWASAITAGAADETAQTVVFVVSNDNNALFSSQPTVSTAGLLSYSLAPNASGVANVSVAVKDNGGIANGGDDTSDAQTLVVTVTSVNDLPTQPSIELRPSDYQAGDALWVEVTTASTDADAGAIITYDQRWYKNGSANAEVFPLTATAVAADLLTPHDTWKIVVTPKDGIGNGVTAWAVKTLPPTGWSATDLDDTDLPSALKNHTAVWTGSEMIVWGGYTVGYSTKTNTGGRYNPVTDSWLPVSTAGDVPSARAYHTAVWSGHEMIIWGGNGGSAVDTGARYDPATDAWTGMATDAAATARELHTAVWAGSEMLVWGGFGSTFLDSGARYDPAANTWSAMSATATTGRNRHSAVWTGSEMIIWGGYNGATTNSGARYFPHADTWSSVSLSAAPIERYSHVAVWTGSEMIVWGGFGGDTSGGRYDPRTDTWSATSTAAGVPSARTDFAGVWTGREMIVWGGYSGDTVNTGGRYDPVTNRWRPTEVSSQTPVRRDSHTAVWTGREMIVWGGRDSDNNASRNTGGRYTPPAATEAWKATNPNGGPPPLNGNSLVWTGSEMIVWAGSIDGAFLPANTGSRYNPTTDTWTATGTGAGVPAARNYHAAVWTGREMIVWGGNNGGNAGGQYNPATDSWVATGTNGDVPEGRTNPKAVWTGREMIAWGGTISDVAQNTGYRYEPLTGTWAATSLGTDAPSARGAHTAIWTGSAMIVWGGEYSGTATNTGSRYFPVDNAWAAITRIAAPTARNYHTAVWTGSEMIVWGGYGDANLNTGGRYNPLTNSWTATSVAAGVPSARSNHTAVWSGREMIVWGGSAPVMATGGRYDPGTDTWIATGSGAGLPEARNWHSAIWTGREMIVWGGITSTFTNTGGRYVP